MYRILLVDDEILVRDAIRENIDWKAMDCELVGDCDNGKAAAEFVQTHPVDIVLTDILMPYMDGMELSRFLHDNYPDIVIVIFSGFGEFEYAKKAIQYDVSEYMLKPVTAMELRNVIEKMKEKVDQRRKEKEKLARLTQTSENYQKNAIVIRSRALQGFVDNIKTRQESLEELAALGIDLEAACYRVAVFDLDLYSDGSQLSAEKRQESALMSFVLFNISDEIISEEKAGVAYQAGNNKVCALFMGNRTREFEQKIMEICRMIQDKLKELVEADGGKVEFDNQNASGESANCTTIVNGFVSEGVDLIMANATAALQAAQAGTSDIPILGTSVTDYGTALGVSDWTGKTGTNISGTTDLAPLDGQADMLKELFPDAKNVGLLYCSAEPNSKYQIDTIKPLLEKLGYTCTEYAFTDSNDVASVTQKAAAASDVMYIPTDNTAASCTEAIANVVIPANVPVIAGEQGICNGCGVATLSIDYYELGQATGEMAYEILAKGANPGDMEVQPAPNFTKMYNKANCEKLGITVPDDYTAIEG